MYASIWQKAAKDSTVCKNSSPYVNAAIKKEEESEMHRG